MAAITELHIKIAAAGLPVLSVRKNNDGTYTADLSPTATQVQIAQAAQIISDEAASCEVSEAALLVRRATDLTEEQQAKLDAQIQADLNMTAAEVATTVDSVFSGFAAAQRTFLKRLVRMVLAAARNVLR